MMFSGLFIKNNRTISYIATALIIFLSLATMCELGAKSWFNIPQAEAMLRTSVYGKLIGVILTIATTVYFVLSGKDIERVGKHVADYYALMFFVLAGAGILLSFQNLLMLFLGVEILTIPLFILTGAQKQNLKSNEASLKYFLMGAFSTGIMLMGIVLIYGAMGSFDLSVIGKKAQFATPIHGANLMGLLLLLASMAFKVSAAPFHFWTPDVYDGAPTVFTSFMATIVKVAAVVAFIRLFEGSMEPFHTGKWQILVSILIACTLLVGNITAVFQQSVKRMLAYSSISQAGYMLFAVFAFNAFGKEGITIYGLSYSLATIGIFSVLSKMQDITFDGFNGLARQYPGIAFALTVFVLSLAGIPLTGGFLGKFYMISAGAASNSSYTWLFILAILCAAVSVYYYFRIIQAMYFKERVSDIPVFEVPVSKAFSILLIVVAALVILIGINPQILLQYLYF